VSQPFGSEVVDRRKARRAGRHDSGERVIAVRQVRRGGLVGIVIIPFLCAIAAARQTAPSNNVAASDYVGNEACAKCHAAIYESYMRSAMAHASGPAADHLIAGEFTHKRSDVHYAIYKDSGNVWLSFERSGDSLVSGKRELLYYIGQGRRGRTYLFSEDGFAFESPVNWYADRKMWDMAPAYGNATEIPLNLPALTSCLNCHVSGVRAPIDGSENKYATPIFLFSGVICERCHGPAAAHVNGGAIVNPAKLPAKLRDQVCMQCHLEGDAAIERQGKHVYEYKPGADLSDYVRYFVLAGNVPQGLRATSQFEALAESLCKKRSGDKMSCTSCHDPHQAVPPGNRVAFYRAKCIACHGERFAAKHHRKQQDCTSCHMPASPSTDVAHTEVTDHRILRRPASIPLVQPSTADLPELLPFPRSHSPAGKDVRELALAWQSLVNSGMSMAQPEADRLLQVALQQFPDDPTILSALAYSAQKRGDDKEARALYNKALQYDPTSIDAASNLGVLDASEGRINEALKLWQAAFERAPGRSEIGMNLTRVYCQAQQFDAARTSVRRVLEFNPDLPSAEELFRALSANPPRCMP
jgi:predicted CXXCH cytochrome family protein